MSVLFELSHADLGYSDGIVLQDFSWTVRSAERWAIVGPNGAGKTTLIRSLLGLIPLLRGSLSYYDSTGQALTQPSNIGYLPQINNIDKSFPISVGEVITSGLYASHLSPKEEAERITELLEAIDLAEYRSVAIGRLSGGQLQRVLLARALASKPHLLVLDEPTSFLDKRYKEQFIQLLHQLCSPQTTILMVTHDLPESERALWQTLAIGQW